MVLDSGKKLVILGSSVATAPTSDGSAGLGVLHTKSQVLVVVPSEHLNMVHEPLVVFVQLTVAGFDSVEVTVGEGDVFDDWIRTVRGVGVTVAVGVGESKVARICMLSWALAKLVAIRIYAKKLMSIFL